MSLSQKQCEKKLKEINLLKKKDVLNREEKDKIEKEKYYKDLIRGKKKFLEQLPDDVQNYILSFLDLNTRLGLLRVTRTPEQIVKKLSTLPNTKLTIKKLYSCVKYVKPILNTYLNKDGDIYKKVSYYVKDTAYHSTTWYDFTRPLPSHCKNLYFDLLVFIIMAGVKNYTKMYKQTTSAKEIQKNEKLMIKLFLRISSF